MAGQDNPGCMENSNMQYVIVKGVNPDEDISSKANAEVVNNDKNIVYTNLGTYPTLMKKLKTSQSVFLTAFLMMVVNL